MNDPIPEPLPEKSVLDWAIPVTRTLNSLRDKAGASTRNERDRKPDKHLPFEVRWDGSLNDDHGGWKIYLPDVESLCMAKEEYQEITGSTPIQDESGDDTPWHTIDDITGSGEEDVWLVVTIPDDDDEGAVTATLTSEEGQATTGEKVYNIHIAELAVVEATQSTPSEHNVRQFVDSAVIISGASDEVKTDDVSIEKIPDPEEGAQPVGDEGKLQIKGFKSGTPADQNSLADYLTGGTSLPSGGILLLARGTDSDGARLFYLPLDALWGDGSSGGLPAPEVTYLDDVAWDQSSHQLVKQWATKNLVTGVETPVQGAPQGKTATISTTAISSIIGS